MRNNFDFKYGRKLMSDYKFYSSYSKYDDILKKKETWKNSVDRIFNMHAVKYSEKINTDQKFQELFFFAKKMYEDKAVLGSQRAMQFGGEPILKHNSKLYNCITGYCDRIKFFQESMYWLLSGCGVGFSVQKQHIAKLPKIKKRSNRSKIFVIEDSIEGWSDAIGVLLSSYTETDPSFEKYQGVQVLFDYSKIRPKGAYISGGFKAPGYEGLRNSIQKIEELLENELSKENFDGKIRPIVAYDIVMHLSDAVLSGGVRRSATIALFSYNDEEMLRAKTGDWFKTNPQRARSNNTVLLERNKITKEEFHRFFEFVKQFGEPGFGFTDNTEFLFNPCFEIGMMPKTKDGISGWQGCVTYDTKLITRDGIVNIGDAAINNQEIEIWNGVKWAKVKPIQTGANRKMYRVKFSDGSYLDCTDNHKFLVKNRFQKKYQEVETTDLISLLSNSKYSINTPRANVVYDDVTNDKEFAYEYGFILGDGTVGIRDNGKKRIPFAELYENSKDLSLPLKGVIGGECVNENDVKFNRIYFNDVDCDFSHKLKYENGLPFEIFSWSRKSMIDFIAGWIDADGTKTTNGCRIYGSKDKLSDGQLLLTKLGITSSLNIMGKKGDVTNMGIRRNDVWYLEIADTKDLYSNRMKLTSTPVKRKGKNQIIKCVELLDGYHDSYCFEEPETHNGLFGNVLTKQCNLVEINGGQCDTEQKFYDACKAAAIIGTMQAGYTDFKYVDLVTKEIFEREALLGVSITGMMNNPKVLFNPEIQRKGAGIVKEYNKIIADMIGINQAARSTCIKPSGNASVLLETASGIHGEKSKNYLRNIQANKEDEYVQLIKKLNPKMVDESVWSSNKTDYVISFPITNNDESIFSDDLLGIKLLEYVKLTQENWVEYGTNVDLCTDSRLRNNVSNTIVVDDWDEVENFLFENKSSFAGVSLLPLTGDKDYNQAPFTSVLTAEELLAKYGDATVFASGLIIDGLNAFNNDLWIACDTVLGNGEKLEYSVNDVESIINNTDAKILWESLGFKNGTLKTLVELNIKPEVEEYKRLLDSMLVDRSHNHPLKIDWVRRARQFSKRYFKNDKEMTYCLKDVNNFHKWIEIVREYKHVEFSEFELKPSYTEIDSTGAIACSGGSCEINF